MDDETIDSFASRIPTAPKLEDEVFVKGATAFPLKSTIRLLILGSVTRYQNAVGRFVQY